MQAGSEPVRLGLIGVGHWGQAILRTLQGMAGVEVVAVCRRGASPAAALPAGCIAHADWRDLLRMDAIAGVIVATPAPTHAEIALAALEMGKAVFVEKPMATAVDDARRVRDAAVRHQAVLHVDHIDLHNRAWQAAVEEQSLLGPVRRIEAEFGAVAARAASPPSRWEWGPHPLALCISLLGVPEVVRAHLRRAGGQASGDLTEVGLVFSSGATAELVVGTGFDERRRRMTLQAERGTVTYDDNAPSKLVRETAEGRASS